MKNKIVSRETRIKNKLSRRSKAVLRERFNRAELLQARASYARLATVQAPSSVEGVAR